MKTKYAFWSYDLPPYILYGEIEPGPNSHHIFVPSYQMHIAQENVIAILPEKAALKAIKEIQKMHKQYQKAITKHTKEMQAFRQGLKTHPKNKKEVNTHEHQNL